jgi:hypothetical protein
VHAQAQRAEAVDRVPEDVQEDLSRSSIKSPINCRGYRNGSAAGWS